MSFVSPIFLVFLVLFFIGTLLFKHKARIVFYTVFSYIFYAFSFPPYIILLFLSSYVDFNLGKRMGGTVNLKTRKLLLTLSLIINLGLLASFKYVGFFAEIINGLLHYLNIPLSMPVPNILLPVGISFYTFQSLSYTFDVYRNKIPPCKSLLDFMCFVAFFPQLVAGPIVRAKEFLPQLAKSQPFQRQLTIIGIELVLFGFFKKTVIADNLAPYVEAIFSEPTTYSGLALWWGTFLFAIQIYADFSGYTDIARGLGSILGIQFPVNFQWPYFSASIQEFWRRWHMTLSFWIRDYLYIPLGGSRVKLWRYSFNMLLTWFLVGLWHGAAVTFIIWGLYHGLLLVFHRAWQYLMPATIIQSRSLQPFKILLTFIMVLLGWVAFRAESLFDVIHIWSKMLNPFNTTGQMTILPPTEFMLLLLLAGAIHGYYYLNQAKPKVSLESLNYLPRVVSVAVFSIAIILLAGTTQTFIYFAF